MNTEPSQLTEIELAQVAAVAADRFGLRFPTERQLDLVRGIGRAVEDLHYRTPSDLVLDLRKMPRASHILDALADHLTVGETYFFREQACFEALRERVLPDIIQARRAAGRRRLRIWSAGCSTGEEPYSLAILLDLLIPDIKEWDIAVLATDINRNFLRTAEQGIYRDWSFRSLPEGMREQYFLRHPDGGEELRPHIRQLVKFANVNLSRDEYPSPVNNTHSMDLILCRNVLMYLEPAVAQGVVRRLESALASDGWLVVSSTDLMLDLFHKLTPAPAAGPVFFKKAFSRPAVPAVPVVTSAHSAIRVLPPDAPLPCPDPPKIEWAAGFSGGPSERVQTPVALARGHADAGRLSDALVWADAALRDDRLDPAKHYLRADILLALGERTAAVAALERAIFLDRDFALAHFTLGVMARHDGKTERSQRYLANALAIVAGMDPQRLLADADGMTAGRLCEVIRSIGGRAMAEPMVKPRSIPRVMVGK
jgi:chemotaxis protein methyltransferase CheR